MSTNFRTGRGLGDDRRLNHATVSLLTPIAAVAIFGSLLVPIAAQTLPVSNEAVDAIRACQVGYLTQESKFACVVVDPTRSDAADHTAVVRREADGHVAFSGILGDVRRDPDSGDDVRSFDFSALRQTGRYYIETPVAPGRSATFEISDDAFSRPLRLAMRAFTGQRCGQAVSLAPDFPQYAHPPCHAAPAGFDPSSGRSGTTDCPGGWHDAGDYGRYTINSAITVGTLLWAYELNEPKLKNLDLDIPPAAADDRPMPDFLAEVKYNLDWMLRMQDADGGVWHKATSASFAGHVMPQEDRAAVLVVGTGKPPFKTTAATADLAAVAAIAARVYQPFDPVYSERCLAAARNALRWALEHPDSHFVENPPGIHTGGYPDKDADDEILWAAAELFRTTGDAAYNQLFLERCRKWAPTIRHDDPQGWPNVANLGMYAYALSRQPLTDATIASAIRADAVAAADRIVQRSRENGYRIPLAGDQYYWGSNAVVANYGMMLRLAQRFEPKPQYADAAQDCLHYLFGRNTFATSYVTHVGTKWAMRPHHRPSMADGIEQPWPGLLVGGPNAERNAPPARQWFDVEGSYKTNEIAINWNAPLVFLLVEATAPRN